MSKTERRIPASEYTSPKWFEQQLAQGWFYADYDGETDEMIWRLQSEWGYGDSTPQQARLQSYGSIYELDRNQLRVLLGKHWDETKLKDWDEERKEPLRQYKEWLRKKNEG